MKQERQCMHNVTLRRVRIPTVVVKKVVNIKYYECVSVALLIQHAKRMRSIMLSFVPCLGLPYLSTLSHKRHDFLIKLLNTKCVFWFSLQHLSETFLILRRIQGVILINIQIWCDFDLASSLICGNKMPTRCNRGFYCRSYCLLNMFRVPLCPSSGAQEYCTVVAACGILCCGFQVSGLVWSWGLCVRFAGCCLAANYSTKYHRQQPLYNNFERLMMGIVVPETCWASNKICNKNLCCI